MAIVIHALTHVGFRARGSVTPLTVDNTGNATPGRPIDADANGVFQVGTGLYEVAAQQSLEVLWGCAFIVVDPQEPPVPPGVQPVGVALKHVLRSVLR